jgi:Holliday junction DNA helicase RuvA
MIAYLKGFFTYKSPTHIYVECAGVGYLVHITLPTYSYIEPLEHGRVFTYLHISEQAHTLYGFSTEAEREMFLHLISVNGIGPNTARLALSSLSESDLQKAIIQQDVSLIQRIKGIGPKTAQRMVLELRDKFSKGKTNILPGLLTGTPDSIITDEAIAAMVMLGFPKPHAEKMVANAMKEAQTPLSVEELIKLSLKNI